MSEESIHQKRQGRQVEGAGWAGGEAVGREQRPPVSATRLSGNHSLIGRDQTVNHRSFSFSVCPDHKRKGNKKSIVSERGLERPKEAETPSKSQARRNVGQRVMDKQELKRVFKGSWRIRGNLSSSSN